MPSCACSEIETHFTPLEKLRSSNGVYFQGIQSIMNFMSIVNRLSIMNIMSILCMVSIRGSMSIMSILSIMHL